MSSGKPNPLHGLPAETLKELARELLGCVTPDGRFVDANPAWFVAGAEPERLHDLFKPAAAPEIDQALRRCTESGHARTFVESRTSNLNLQLQLVRGDDQALFATAEPVDPDPHSAHLAVRNAAVSVMMVDRDGCYRYVNEAYCRTYGYGRDELMGKSFTEVLSHDEVEQALAFHQRVFAEPELEHRQEMAVVRKDGSPMRVSTFSRCITLPDGEMRRLATIIDVTAIRDRESRLAQTEAEYREIFNHTSEGLYRSSPDGRLIRANPSLVRMHGFREESELLNAITDLATDWYVDPDARDKMTEALEQQERIVDFEHEMHCLGSGSRIWVSESARAVRDAYGNVRFYEGSVRDISAHHRARQLAEHRGSLLEMIARGQSLTRILYELAGAIEQLYPRLTVAILTLDDGLLEVSAAPGLANSCIEALDKQAPSDVGSVVAHAMRDSGSISAEDLEEPAESGPNAFIAAARGAGYGSVLVNPVRDQEDRVLGMLMVFAQFSSDTSGENEHRLLVEMGQMAAIAMEQARLHEELRYQAQYDALTGLPNRTLLDDRLQQAIRDAERGSYPVGVLLLDLDEFKLINDTLGHRAGDELLEAVADRLRDCMRSSDTVARLGGDEFVLIAPMLDGSDASDIAERLLAALQDEFLIQDRYLAARPSIGISLYPEDGATAESLLQAADTAMYAAKNSGKNDYRYFAETMNRLIGERMQIETGLRKALTGDELELYYQPQVRLEDGSLVGAEALLRWRHPIHGLLLPGTFLPIAERSSLINDVDRLVLIEAARQLAATQARGHNIIVSVNLSARDLGDADYGAKVCAILEQSGADPSGIELEITESMFMQDFEQAVDQLRDLKERAPGLRIAIDDFGMGHSSLNYLRRLPVDTLKIDRSFVADLDDEATADTAHAIAQTIIDLGRNLRLHVIAEGVETDAQARRLKAMGCHDAQGFWFGRPMPWAELEAQFLQSEPATVKASPNDRS